RKTRRATGAPEPSARRPPLRCPAQARQFAAAPLRVPDRGPRVHAVTIPKVAIACQGGGSHAAFAAGILSGLLRPGRRERFQLVALTGTSGGAVCASLAWRGLVA